VVVVGSGLAAVGAVKAIIANGERPLVLDIGHTLPSHLELLRQSMATCSPSEWDSSQREELSRNEGVSGKLVPRKLVMGSSYFYSKEQGDIPDDGNFQSGTPPWSPARGGFSVGWGAAVLPPAMSDLAGWPVSHGEILSYARLATNGIPLSEPIDDLTPIFGSLRNGEAGVISLSSGQSELLRALQKKTVSYATSQVLVGQSRLLTESGADLPRSCRRCGYCSAGCVYGSIYSAEQDIALWIAEDKITYLSDAQVFRVIEQSDVVRIDFVREGKVHSVEADRLFLAAGAVSTSRILLNSVSIPLDTVTLRRTGGVLQVFAGLRGMEIAWPEVNTQTSHLIELRADDVSPHWAHVQVGQPNELVLRKLGVKAAINPSVRQRIAKRAAGHLITTMLNVHSEHGHRYEMRVVHRRDGIPPVETRQTWPHHGRQTVNELSNRLGKFLRRAGFWSIPFARQDSAAAQGYHIGASFPMTSKPRNDTDTDTLGRPFGWTRVHVVDTSVLPAIPASGIGLITTANAYRIASESIRM
jgi:choline dehydrogenase-like flavoprotein